MPSYHDNVLPSIDMPRRHALALKAARNPATACKGMRRPTLLQTILSSKGLLLSLWQRIEHPLPSQPYLNELGAYIQNHDRQWAYSIRPAAYNRLSWEEAEACNRVLAFPSSIRKLRWIYKFYQSRLYPPLIKGVS